MTELFFWKHWQKTNRFLYTSVLILLLFTIIYYLASYFIGSDAIINWVVVSKNKAISAIHEGANLGVINLNYNVDNFLINESYEGSNLKTNFSASYILLTLIFISLSVYLTIITRLKRFWFIIGTVIFMVLMINFKFDQLLILGSYKNLALYAILAVYLPLLYYFHAFNYESSFLKRLLVFSLITAGFGAGLTFLAGVAHPLQYISNYGIMFPVILTILFIFSVSIELVAGFLYVTTSGVTMKSKNSLLHFSVLTLVYLINLALVYAKNRQFIDWDFYYIDEFYLLLASALVGIWGFRHRENLYKGILSFEIGGSLLYLITAIVSFSTIGYLFATGNDPLIETMEDAIVFSHLSFGLFFYIYIISNFIGALHQNLQVYKVMYKPKQMPYYVMRFIALVGVGALFFQSGQLALNQGIAGYYNGIGDLYRTVDEDYVAEQYYKMASQFEFQNHRSNYGLASLANQRGNLSDALYYYQQSILKKPTPYAYVNLANIYAASGLFFDAVFSLNEGIKAFPGNPYLYNNLGLLYTKTKVVDSSLIFLNYARNNKATKQVSTSNLLAVMAENGLDIDLDSLNQVHGSSKYLPVKNNLLVNNNLENKFYRNLIDFDLVSDSTLNPNTFAYLYNLGLNYSIVPDTILNQVLDSKLKVNGNFQYMENLETVKAINAAGEEALITAFKLMDKLQLQNTLRANYYNNIIGLWALDQQNYSLAREFFNKASPEVFPDAAKNLGFTMMAMDSLGQALNIFHQYQLNTRSTDRTIQTLLQLIENDSLNLEEASDQEKMLWIQIHNKGLSSKQIDELISQVGDQYFQKYYKIWQLKVAINNAASGIASELIADIETEELAYPNLQRMYRTLKFEYWALTGNWENVSDQLENLPESEWLLKAYLKAKLAERGGKNEEAYRHYLYISNKNPFKTHYIIDAANFFQNKMNEENLAYETILNALEINPNAASLSKAYIWQCLKMGLSNYAEGEIDHLRRLVPINEYSVFMNEYLKELAERELRSEWE